MAGAAVAGVQHGGRPIYDGRRMYGGENFERQELPHWGGGMRKDTLRSAQIPGANKPS